MSTIAKVFTVLNLVFALFLTGSVSTILAKSEDYKKKWEDEVVAHTKSKADADEKVKSISGDRDNFAKTNDTLKNQKSDLESELANAKSTADQARNDNNQLRNSVDAIQASLKTVQSELQDVQARNKALMDSNAELTKAAKQAEDEKLNAQDDRTRVEGDLKRANDDIAAKEAQLVELSKERDNLRAQLDALVKLGVDVPGLIGNNVPLIEGKVSAVGPGFVVLSVGEQDNVKIGYPFDVYRGGDYIGRVVVDNVLPDSCTARVQVKNAKGLDFQAMDSATTRL